MDVHYDPRLDDMLADPIILMVMSSDRVAADDARLIFGQAADRIKRRAEADGFGSGVSANGRALRSGHSPDVSPCEASRG